MYKNIKRLEQKCVKDETVSELKIQSVPRSKHSLPLLQKRISLYYIE